MRSLMHPKTVLTVPLICLLSAALVLLPRAIANSAQTSSSNLLSATRIAWALGRTTHRTSEDVSGTVIVPAALANTPLKITVHRAPMAMRLRWDYEQTNDTVGLAKLLKVREEVPPALIVLHTGKVGSGGYSFSIKSGMLPPDVYQIRVTLAGDPSSAGRFACPFVVMDKADWRNGVFTATDAGHSQLFSMRELLDTHIKALQADASGKADYPALDRWAVFGVYAMPGFFGRTADRPVDYHGRVSGRAWMPTSYATDSAYKDLSDSIHKLSEMFAHPNILSYWTINEVYDNEAVDYSAASVRQFQGFLRDQLYHNDIGELNAAWGANYASFDDVLAPLPWRNLSAIRKEAAAIATGKPANELTEKDLGMIMAPDGAMKYLGSMDKSGNRSRYVQSIDAETNRYAWVDWTRFKTWAMAQFLDAYANAIKQNDPDKRPVAHKVIDYKFTSPNHYTSWWENAHNEDVFGYDSYAGHWIALATFSSIAASIKAPAYNYEWNRPGAPGAQRAAEAYTAFIHGHGMLTYFTWHRYAEKGAYFGMLGEDPGVIESMARAYGWVSKLDPILGQTRVTREPILVIYPETTYVQASLDSIPGETPTQAGASSPSYRSSEADVVIRDFNGLVAGLIRYHAEPDFLPDYMVSRTDLSKYKIIFAVGTQCMHPDTASKLTAFVNRGGTLVTDYRAGYWDQGKQPKQVLKDLLGFEQSLKDEPGSAVCAVARAGQTWHTSMSTVLHDPDSPDYNGRPLSTYLRCQRTGGGNEFRGAQDVNAFGPGVLDFLRRVGARRLAAVGENVTSALIVRPVGKGRVFYCGYPLGMALSENPDPQNTYWLLDYFFSKAGLSKRVRIMDLNGREDLDTDASARFVTADPDAEFTVSSAKGVLYLPLVNHGQAGKRVVSVAGRYEHARELISGRMIHTSYDGKRTVVDLSIPSLQGRCLELYNTGKVSAEAYPRQDSVEVTLRGETGIPVRIWLEGENGVRGEERTVLVRNGMTTALRKYGIMAGKVRLRSQAL